MVTICVEVDLSAGIAYALAPFVMLFAHQVSVPFLPVILLTLTAPPYWQSPWPL
jgi:ribose/xylose/arabinose/galactoside ABC-type transport system permease subunit